jgi:RNA polymerase sigma-70 factor (ECF subfamily)
MTAPARREVVADDAALVARVAEGNLDALGKLFDRFQPEVRRLVRRLGTPPGDVDDLVQLTFLDVARSAGRYDPALAARSWILGVAAMIVRRHRRSVGRWLANLAGHVFERRRPRPRTPDEALEREQEQARFERALDRLSAKRREVFVLVVMEETSGEEAAAALGIPVATVWTRLHYARRDLRAQLSGEPEREEDT